MQRDEEGGYTGTRGCMLVCHSRHREDVIPLEIIHVPAEESVAAMYVYRHADREIKETNIVCHQTRNKLTSH